MDPATFLTELKWQDLQGRGRPRDCGVASLQHLVELRGLHVSNQVKNVMSTVGLRSGVFL
jgi:hypothetical protein